MFYELKFNSGLRTYLEINTNNLKHNFELIKEATNPNCGIIAIVKANAYGHGDIAVCNILKNDVSYFAVAEYNEAQRLRKNNIKTPIIILGMTSTDVVNDLVDNNITQSVHSYNYAYNLNNELKKLNKRLKVHIKLNTGMTRLGFDCESDSDINEIIKTCSLPNLDVEGIFSHFAESDNTSSEYTQIQIKRFDDVIDKLEKNNITFKYKHISNSAGNIFYDNSKYNLVRVGIMLYGFFPSDETEKEWNKKFPPLRPVMTFKSRISQIRSLNPGTPIGYGRSYITKDYTKIAIINAGYADGIPRLISGKTSAIQNGCKIVGKVCMDMCFVDITNCKHVLKEGDFITLFGENSISAKMWADAAETITYEILCSISDRVPRIII